MQCLNVLFSQAHCLVLKFQCFHFFGSQLLACVCVRGLLCVFKYTWHRISIYHVLLYLYFVSVRSRRPCMCKYTSRTTPHHILYLEFWRYCFTKFCSFCASPFSDDVLLLCSSFAGIHLCPSFAGVHMQPFVSLLTATVRARAPLVHLLQL